MQQGPHMNPYAPPVNPNPMHPGMGMGRPSSPAEAAARGMCPKCGNSNVHQPSFTWWGGMLGPKMFNHWVCRACGFGYNGSTGESNRNKIIAYVVIVNVVVLGLLVVVYSQ